MSFSISILLLCCYPLIVFGEELPAFADTSPAMHTSLIYSKQIAWQKKYGGPVDSKRCSRNAPRNKIEVVRFRNKQSIVLLHVGCDNSTLFIRYEFRFTKDPERTIEWSYTKVIKALELVRKSGHKHSFNIPRTISYVKNLIAIKDLPNYGEWSLIKRSNANTNQVQFSVFRSGPIKSPKSRYGFIEFGWTRGL